MALLAEREEQIHNVWTKNLRDMVMSGRREEKQADIWQFVTEVMQSNGQIEIPGEGTLQPATLDRQEVDVETGEIIPYGPVRTAPGQHPLQAQAIKESRAVGMLYKAQMLESMANRLTTLINQESARLQMRETHDLPPKQKRRPSAKNRRPRNVTPRLSNRS
jgi:hypothetical protein